MLCVEKFVKLNKFSQLKKKMIYLSTTIFNSLCDVSALVFDYQ